MPEAFRDHAELSVVSDEELMEQIVLKDEASFTELTRRYSGYLSAYLRQYIGNADDADEILQELFLSVWAKGNQFKQGNKVRPWLYSIATHRAIDLQRKAKLRESRLLDTDQLFDESGDPITVLDVIPDRSERVLNFPDHMIEEVRLAVGALTPIQSSSIQMAYWQDLQYQEMADILRIPVGTVKSRLHSGVNALRKSMGTSVL